MSGSTQRLTVLCETGLTHIVFGFTIHILFEVLNVVGVFEHSGNHTCLAFNWEDEPYIHNSCCAWELISVTISRKTTRYVLSYSITRANTSIDREYSPHILEVNILLIGLVAISVLLQVFLNFQFYLWQKSIVAIFHFESIWKMSYIIECKIEDYEMKLHSLKKRVRRGTSPPRVRWNTK